MISLILSHFIRPSRHKTNKKARLIESGFCFIQLGGDDGDPDDRARRERAWIKAVKCASQKVKEREESALCTIKQRGNYSLKNKDE